MGLNKGQQIKVFLGTGGVGKTTLASIYAIQIARSFPDKKVKLVTIDPSKRLKDYFGLLEGETLKQIDNLSIGLSDREILFKDFVLESLNNDITAADKVYKNKVFQRLLAGLAVSQEFTSLYELHKGRGENHDFLIIDTPPLQNAGAFLGGAKALEDLFSSSLTKFFIPEKGHGLLYKLFFGVRQKGLGILSNLTGSDFVGELNDFFLAVESLRPKLIEVLNSSQRILFTEADIMAVCNNNELSLAGLKLSVRKLKGKGLKFERCYVNKCGDSMERKAATDKKMVDLVKENPSLIFTKVFKFKIDPHSYADLLEVSEDVEF